MMEFPLSERYELLVYTDERVEYFRMSQILGNGKRTSVINEDRGLGRSIVDIYHADIPSMFNQLDCHAVDSIRSTAECAMRWGGIFLPLWAELISVEKKLEAGVPTAFIEDNELDNLKCAYLNLQRRVKEILPTIFLDGSVKDALPRYYALGKEDVKDIFTPLDFGTRGVHFMPVRGDNELPVPVLSSMNPEEIFDFLLYQAFQSKTRFRLCNHCNRYFGFGRKSKQIYCDRLIDDSTKRCMDVGSIRKYDKRAAENPVTREYKRAYKTRNARIRYGKMTREEFDSWAAQAREKRDLCLSGQLSLEEFVAWLDRDKLT